MAGVTEVRVTSNGKSRNYIAFVCETLTREDAGHVVVLSATGLSTAKAVSVAEVAKTLVPGLHQLNELLAAASENGDDKGLGAVGVGADGQEDGDEMEGSEDSRGLLPFGGKSLLRISLSKSASALPRSHYGYQAAAEAVTNA